MKRITCLLAACLVISITTLSPADARAEEQSAWVESGLGIGSVASTFLWGTAKTLFAVGGTLTGGLAYLFTGFNSRAARPIFQASLRGDYVVTPEHLRGRKPLSFIGRDPRYEPYPYEE
jgi:hypothetical protein